MKKKILLIEDEPKILKDLKKTLELCNYEPICCSNGFDGLENATTMQPDLIISDIMLPEIDGFEILSSLQKNPATSTIPFLFLSAKTERKYIREGMKLGADDFITKPYDIDELIQAIEIRLKKKENNEDQYSKKMKMLQSSINRALPHELRTPLSLILGYSDYILKKIEFIPQGELVEMVENIYDAAKRLNRIFENYLFFANLETISSNPAEFNKLRGKKIISAESIICDVVSFQAEKVQRDKDLRLSLVDSELYIPEDIFIKMIEEIIDNCLKFSSDDTYIEIKSYIENNHYFITFTDYGRGMAEEQIKNIGAYIQFERKIYEQQGTGLGMAIVKKIIKMFRGTFAIESEPNKYTTVIISIPLTKDDNDINE